MSSFWKNRVVLVTGANGFIGAHLVRQLIKMNAKVICLQHDAVRPGLPDILSLREKVTIINGSVEDFEFLRRILNQYEIEAVFHLAAQSIVGAANRSPLATFETNIRGTYLLLEACRLSEFVRRVVVASSDKAYGSHENLPIQEDFPLRGRFPYEVSKTCTDVIAQSFAYSYQLPVTVIRSSNVYGEGDLNLSRIIPGTILSILKNERPIIRSDGTPIREFIHVDDVTDGYLLLAEKIDETKGEPFNFGTNEPIQMVDLVKRILNLMGKEKDLPPNILLKTKIEREIDAQYLSTEKIFKQFGWKAKISLDEGLKRTIDWYRKHFAEIR